MYFSREIFGLFLREESVREYLSEPFKLDDDLESWQQDLIHHTRAHAKQSPIRNREEALSFTYLLAQTGLPIKDNPALTEVLGPGLGSFTALGGPERGGTGDGPQRVHLVLS